jgi:chlorobactene glucosyltransferase
MLEFTIYVIFALLTVIIIFFTIRLMFAFKHFEMKPLIDAQPSLKKLPSVSICIPARNEMHALTQCLERVIASDYEKLEIIVLDDSSVDDTSVIIKSFAHAGVRFVEGSPLPEGWMGRNHALQGLLDEASGSYIFFMGVDTYIQPNTVSLLVDYMMQQDVSMVSVLPRRSDSWRTSVLMGTLRYFWELILHRRSSPAVSTGAWMIDRNVLINKLGGFEPIKDQIKPEAALAKALMQKGIYRFLLGTPNLGVSYEKRWLSQIDTSVRLLYSYSGHSVWSNALTFLILLILNSPTFIILYGLIGDWGVFQVMAVWKMCVFIALYGLYLAKLRGSDWWAGALLWPVLILQELIVYIVGLYRNLRRSVSWKGRPAMLPVRSTTTDK